ncbi:tetratricopeptide repeat protein [Alsobacter sp. SYSU M60028]|uniref:Tetratricopeptide repeat protein n=1 Tax=Alsobacter ponti TaxID=2962936 RepID=A0ABT1LC88_9HYPH|nr:tetratricopeptide repeat protein [Alsobacter ponti]MCP8937863.1 tetratricopeptide repeat protein [Alsobacter ponti]
MPHVRSVTLAAILCLTGLTGCQSLSDTAIDGQPAIESGYAPQAYAGDPKARSGKAHLDAGEYGLAEQSFRAAVEATPRDGAAWVGLAASYDRLGRFDLADRAYREAIKLQGETVTILNNQGYSYMLRGDVKTARAKFEKARRLDPENQVVLNNLELLYAGQQYFRGEAP